MLIVGGLYVAVFLLFTAFTPIAGALGNLSSVFEIVGNSDRTTGHTVADDRRDHWIFLGALCWGRV